MPTDHFTQLFYRAYFLEHLKTASQFAEYVSEVLTALKWLVIDQNGKSVTDKTETLRILELKAQEFIDSDKIQIAKQLKLFN